MTTPKEKDMPVACSHVAECVNESGLSVTLSSTVGKKKVVAAVRLCSSLENL